MATIVNPTPVTPSVFGGMWITSLAVFADGKVSAQLLPFDGSHLLATGGIGVNGKQLSAPTLAALITEAKRQAATTVAPKMIQVMAQDPTKPVTAQILFADTDPKTKPHRIADCYALAGTDTQFATVFGTVLAEVAGLAGLTVS